MTDAAGATDGAGVPSPQLAVSPDPAALAAAVTDRLLAVVLDAQRARGTASLLITGGRVMKQVLQTLAGSDAGAGINWPAVDVWWADERWVPAGTTGAEGRNDVEFDPVAAAVPLDPARIHRMPATGEFPTPEAAAAAYAAALAASAGERGEDGEVPHFDVGLLGVGEDGHCASLFPGAPATRETSTTVVAVHDSPKPPPVRLSVTFLALAAAEQLWFVTAGEGKADAVGRAVTMALTGHPDGTAVPSSAPRGRAATWWLIDEAAAAQVPSDLR